MKVTLRPAALMLLVAFAAAVAAPQGPTPNVEEFFKLLPERYVTHEGDYGRLVTTADAPNGYLAISDVTAASAPPVFEFALYHSADGGRFFVAANTKYDHACHSFETFFLRHDGRGWGEAGPGVMPPLAPSDFFRERAAAALVAKHEGWRSYLRHRPARRGTTLEVSLELCDVAVENDPQLTERERERLATLLARRPPAVTLRWNRREARFELARTGRTKN
jgi:hypothetical protein